MSVEERDQPQIGAGALVAIWRILEEYCGAAPIGFAKDGFLCLGRVKEYRFQGLLGFGGKFWNANDKWYVTCYLEDATPWREDAIADANRALSKLKHWMGGPCEFDPKTGLAVDGDKVHARATWIVGHKGNWRLCDECEKLPRFKGYKVRKQIEQGAEKP